MENIFIKKRTRTIMKVVIKCRIEIIQRSTPQNPGYRGNGTRQKNNFEWKENT